MDNEKNKDDEHENEDEQDRGELIRTFTLKFDEMMKLNNYNGLKQHILDVAPIVKDFKGLLQRKPLFERSSFMYLNPLAKES